MGFAPDHTIMPEENSNEFRRELLVAARPRHAKSQATGTKTASRVVSAAVDNNKLHPVITTIFLFRNLRACPYK
jgi:hypothetical protein